MEAPHARRCMGGFFYFLPFRQVTIRSLSASLPVRTNGCHISEVFALTLFLCLKEGIFILLIIFGRAAWRATHAV